MVDNFSLRFSPLSVPGGPQFLFSFSIACVGRFECDGYRSSRVSGEADCMDPRLIAFDPEPPLFWGWDFQCLVSGSSPVWRVVPPTGGSRR